MADLVLEVGLDKPAHETLVALLGSDEEPVPGDLDVEADFIRLYRT